MHEQINMWTFAGTESCLCDATHLLYLALAFHNLIPEREASFSKRTGLCSMEGSG